MAVPQPTEVTQNAGRSRPHCRLIKAMLALAGIAFFLGFIALGTWQVQRRAWKLDLIERVQQRVHAAPTALPAPALWPQIDATHYEYQPLKASGRLLYDKTVFAQASTELGSGFWVLTPLQLDDNSQVLINRGYIPENLRKNWQERAEPADQVTVTVTGLLRISEPGGGFLRRNDPAQQRWHSRDVAAIAQAQGLDHAAPYFIDAGLPGSVATTWPRPGMTVIAFHNSHLVYALTWYGLALMVLGGAWLVIQAEKKRH